MSKTITLSFLWLLLFHIANGQERNVSFIENKNQFDAAVLYKANLPSGAVFLTQQGFVYSYFKAADLDKIHHLQHDGHFIENEKVNFHAYQVNFFGSNASATLTPANKLPYYHNYFIGNNTKNHASKVALYNEVQYAALYKGIDLKVYSQGTALKYDFIVQPHADVRQIVLEFKGVTPKILSNGSLQITTTVNEIIEQKPYAYQIVDGVEQEVVCQYKLTAANKLAYHFPKGYNGSLPLVIDPLLVFSTFSGSTSTTFGYSATYDTSGHLYAGGESFNVGWPVSIGAFQQTFGGSVDAGLNKYSADGSLLIYSTYYGGISRDLPNNMMVNNNDELVVCGSTWSYNLATTVGCFNNIYGGYGDIFIARFSVDGTILRAATFLGGTAVDGYNIAAPNMGDANRGEVLTAPDGSIYIANSSASGDFPVTAGAYQTIKAAAQDGVVARLDSNLSTLMYSTFLGGNQNDACYSLVLTAPNEVAVCGGTWSTDFPTTAGAMISADQGGVDGFASIINLSTGLTHSTLLGTNAFDHAFKIQRDPLGNILVMGQTKGAYPVSAGVYSVTNGDIFIDKLTPNLGSSIASTTLGNVGSGFVSFIPTAFLYDVCGNTYLSGFNAAATSPLTPNAYQSTPGSFWLGALGPNFSSLLYGTFLGVDGHVDGGTSRFDPQGIVYHSVCTPNPNFPTTASAYAPVKLSSSYDIASFKFNMEVGGIYADFKLANNASDTGCADYTVTFDNLSINATNYFWNFGDGNTSTQFNPTHTFEEGIYNVSLLATGPNGCVLKDSATRQIVVKPSIVPQFTLADTFLCDAVPINIAAQFDTFPNNVNFHWEPAGALLSAANQHSVTVNPSLSNVFTLSAYFTEPFVCSDTATKNLTVHLFDYSNMYALPLDTSICPGDTVMLRAFGGSTFQWSPNHHLASVNTRTTAAWPVTDINYQVLITNDSGCKAERIVGIHIYPKVAIDAGPDKVIKIGESTVLNAKGAVPFAWTPSGLVNPANSLTPEVRPDKTTTYYLSSITSEGCMMIDSLTVYVTNAMLPNAFSPNGDGLNDVFKLIPQDENVSIKDFSVYNRYGQKVFFTRDITEGWDGHFNGKPADVAVYFYLVRYIIGENTYTLKGDVTLVR